MAADTNKDVKGGEEEFKLGGNIALVGFESLDDANIIIVKKLVGTYVKKMNNHGKYKEMRLSLRQHAHGKSFKHEVEGLAIFEEGRFESSITEWNLFTAVSQVCDKLLEAVKQKSRKVDKHSLKKEE